MALDIASILANKNFDEPPEVQRIKQYVQRHFQEDVSVAIKDNYITITVSGSALAGALHMQLTDMHQECETEKKLVIRIG